MGYFLDSTVSSVEALVGLGSPAMVGPVMPSPSFSSVIPNASNFQVSNLTSPMQSTRISSPVQSVSDQSISTLCHWLSHLIYLFCVKFYQSKTGYPFCAFLPHDKLVGQLRSTAARF